MPDNRTQTKVVAVQPGATLAVLHPVTGAPVRRVVRRVSNHPTLGVTVWYTDGFPPDHLPPGATVDVVT